MLIRIVNDPRAGNETQEDGTPLKNSELIDKLIAVEGLPSTFYLRPNSQWTVLRMGLEPDIRDNMPDDIYEKYGKPFEVDVVYPAVEKGEKPWAEKLTVHGIKIDTQTNDGNKAVAELERIIRAATPVQETTVKAEPVGDRLNWHMTVEEVPFVDVSALSPKKAELPAPPPVALPAKEPEEPPMKEGYCAACNKTFMNKKALRMHTMKAHGRQKARV